MASQVIGGVVTEFRLLGPPEVRAAGRVLDLGRPQQSLVLAVLLVDAGRLVPMDVLVDRVWGDTPPARVRRSLYTHVTRIRGLLAAAADPSVRLLRRTGGYLVEIDPDRVDLHRFGSLVERARDPRWSDGERAALLEEALGLWRGEPLTGLLGPVGSWLHGLRQRCRKQRLDAVVVWASAEVACGNAARVIGAVADLIDEDPLVEPLTVVLMRALHALGRDAEALDGYTRLRRRLVAELGTEPGAELRGLQRAILRGEVEPAQRAAVATAATPAVPPRWAAAPVPAQLPLDIPGFTARCAELARLDALAGAAGRRSTAMVISAVSGMAGVGKTALAVHWAHRNRHRFPDGQLYVNLRGFTPSGSPLRPADAVGRFLDALGVPPTGRPAGVDAQAALYRSLLADRRVLVLLDNAFDAEQVRPLLPGSPGCLVLVTSRNELTSLVAAEGACPEALDVLAPADARDLLAERVEAGRMAAEPEAVEQIIASCAGLPLALAVAAARAATTPGLTLAALAEDLRSAGGGLGGFTGGDTATDVRAVFSSSYRTLSAAAARLFRLLGLHPGPDLNAPAAASLVGQPLPQLLGNLAELTAARLVSEHRPGRYTLHDLLRGYAAELARTVEADTDRRAATRRMLDHYLHTAHGAALLIEPYREPIALPEPYPGVIAEKLAGDQQALAWFGAEHAVLLAAVEHAAASGFDQVTQHLAWTLIDYLDRHGDWHRLAATQEAALAAARRRVDSAGQAHAHRVIADARARLGDYGGARSHLQQALDLHRRIGDRAGQAHVQHNLGWILQEQGRPREALGHARRALKLYRAADHRAGQARALNNIGWLHAQLGDHRQALRHCQQALALHVQLGYELGQAHTWDSLGYAHLHLGELDQARVDYEHARDLYRKLGDRYDEADTVAHLGDIHVAAGDLDAATAAWRTALATLEELQHPDADDVRGRLRRLGVSR